LLIFDCRWLIEKPAQSMPVFDFQSAFKNQQSAIPVVERALLSRPSFS
jgi:hypothetical protein